jgi:pyridoxamine 5'-phosphate oxidase family protein
MTFTDSEQRFLAQQPLGHLATVGPDGTPQVKPVDFTYNQALGTIDIAGVNMAHSAKYRNIRVNPKVAFVIDEVTGPGMGDAHFLEIRGVAEHAIGPVDPTGHLDVEIIRIRPSRVLSFNIDPARPGFTARNVAPASSSDKGTGGAASDGGSTEAA